jgi:hypothetical protein
VTPGSRQGRLRFRHTVRYARPALGDECTAWARSPPGGQAIRSTLLESAPEWPQRARADEKREVGEQHAHDTTSTIV